MKHELTESEKLKLRFLIGLGVVILFFIPSTIVLVNKFGYKESKIITKLNNNSSFLILVKNSTTDYRDLEQIFKNKNLDYEILDSDDSSYSRILHKLDMTTTDISEPTVIYISDGQVYSSLVDANKKELKVYINNLEKSWS